MTDTVPLMSLSGRDATLEAVKSGALLPESLTPGHRLVIIERLAQEAVALADENNRLKDLVQELQQTVNVESMTGLLNRRGFEEQFNAWRDSNKDNPDARIGIIYLDMDRLKKDFNDAFSHDVGDQAIKYLANALRHVTREADIVARFGGDEFVMAIPGDKRAQVHDTNNLANDDSVFDVQAYVEALPGRIKAWLQSSVEANSDAAGIVDKLNEALANMQFSYGGIVYGREALTSQLKNLLHGADQLMYLDKKSKKSPNNIEYHI